MLTCMRHFQHHFHCVLTTQAPEVVAADVQGMWLHWQADRDAAMYGVSGCVQTQQGCLVS